MLYSLGILSLFLGMRLKAFFQPLRSSAQLNWTVSGLRTRLDVCALRDHGSFIYRGHSVPGPRLLPHPSSCGLSTPERLPQPTLPLNSWVMVLRVSWGATASVTDLFPMEQLLISEHRSWADNRSGLQSFCLGWWKCFGNSENKGYKLSVMRQTSSRYLRYSMMVTRVLTVVVITQCICISNHIVHIKYLHIRK
jgi:hypothetical protein